jgi:hypothetical protein
MENQPGGEKMKKAILLLTTLFLISVISTTTFAACNAPCTPKWRCSSWSPCIGKYQSRFCFDGCGHFVFESGTCYFPRFPQLN